MEPLEVHLLRLIIGRSSRAVDAALAAPIQAPSVHLSLIRYAHSVVRATGHALEPAVDESVDQHRRKFLLKMGLVHAQLALIIVAHRVADERS